MFAGDQEVNGFPVGKDPPSQILTGESSFRACGGSGECKDGKGLGREGLPEDVEFGRKEKDSLAERIDELEKELYDYQYQLGLLLIEKKMRTSQFEELREELSEARANLKRERAAFSSALSEKQKQEQSILMALEAERQHVADLEKSIYKMLGDENYLNEQRETLQCWGRSLQGHELEFKRSQTFLGERKLNITNEKEPFSEIQEEVEESQNSFVNASNYKEAGVSDRQQDLASKDEETESKHEKLEKKGRDLVGAGVNLPTRESALQIEKQAFEQELVSGRESLDGELKDKLNKLEKQNAVDGESGGQMIDDLLASKKEVETDKVRVKKDKETLSTLYNKLQKFKQDLIKKRDHLLSLTEHCKACMNCKIAYSELDLASLETFEGSELSGEIEHGNGARKIEIIERFPKAVHSSEQYSAIANDALEIKCQPNASSIDEQTMSHALSSEGKKGRARPNKRTGSLNVVIENSEETLDDMPKEIKQLQKCGSEDSKDANEESKLSLLNANKIRGCAKQWEHLCYASETASMIDPYDRKTQPANEGQRKRQRTSDIRLSFPGQKRYNFRTTTMSVISLPILAIKQTL